MKKQINPTIKAHLIRSAFYVLLLLAVCVIPFALAQRNTGGKNTASKSPASKNVVKHAGNGVARTTTTFGPNDPRRKAKSKSASSTGFRNAHGTVPRPVVNAPSGTAPAGVACWYDFTPSAATFVPGVDDIGNHTDDGDTFITLPFTVNLYGQSFTSALVGSNGQVAFGTDYTSFVITCPPPFGGTDSTDVLAPYWGDQCTNTAGCGGGESCAGCGIFTTTTGSSPNRIFYIEWRTQYYNQSTPLLDYEIVLYENGTPSFSIIYSNISAAGAANDSQLVVGQKFDENCFTVFGCDTTGGQSPPVSSGQALDAVAAATPTPTPPPLCSPWATASPYPTTIVRYGFVQTDTDFYVFGGVDNGSITNAVNKYNIASGTWTPLSPMPFGSEAPTCALDASTGIVYCAEGDDGAGGGNAFASYNIATDSWTPLASDPLADRHYGSASGAFNGKVFVAGGFVFGDGSAQVDVYDIASDTWSSGTAAPAVFFLAGYQQVGQFLYVVGGFEPTFANNATTWRLDLSTGTWDVGPAFTPQFADFGLAYDASQNKLYSLGGDLPNDGNPFNSTNQVNELDLSAWPGGTWTHSTPDLPLPKRQANQAGFYGGGNIWSVGGINGSTFTFFSDVFARPSCAGGGGPCTLQPWQIVANYPLVIESPAVCSDGTFGYVAGGRDSATFLATDAFNQYDPVANTWTPLASLSQPIRDARAVYAANTNSIYVFGGIDINELVSNVVQIYDLASGTWTTGTPMPAERFFPATVYYDPTGLIYVAGGLDGTFFETDTTWIYDPVAGTWDTSTAPNIPVVMGGSAVSLVGQNMYLQGSFGAGATNLNYSYDIVANTWTQKADMPAAVYEAAGASIGTNTYVVGGGDPAVAPGSVKANRKGAKGPNGSMATPDASFTSTYIYDTVGDSWSTGPSTNVAHSFTGGTAIGNKLVVVGGFDGVTGDTNTVETSDCGEGPPPTPTPTPTVTPTPTPGGSCPPVITESTSQAIVDGNSVACQPGISTTHYWRAFDMATFTGGLQYDITSVEFGIELAQSATGTGQSVTVNLYTNSGTPFPNGTLTQIATSGMINVPDQADAIFNVPITVTVPAGTFELVMEVVAPDGDPTNNFFFIGSNPDPETRTSYISAPDCNTPDPVPVADIGFPDMHYVINVDGSCPGVTPTPTPTSPTPTATATATITPPPSATPTATATATSTPRPTPTPRPRPTPYPRPTP
jgi:Kelch motif